MSKKQSKQDAILNAIENITQTTVSNSSFTGVHYDAKAVDAINVIAEGAC